MTKAELRTEVKRLTGNQSGGDLTTAWYDTRVLNGYFRLVTFQGVVNSPGFRHPIFRVLRFPVIEDRLTNSLTTSLTDNFVAYQAGVKAVVDVFNRTDDIGLSVRSEKVLRQLDPDEVGKPREWWPGVLSGTRGYYIWPKPGTVDDNIDVYEYVVKDVTLASDGSSPIIEAEWHIAIVYAGAAEAARLLDMPEKAAEMDTLLTNYIGERVSPGERTSFIGRAGGRRHIRIGGWS